MIVTVKVIVDGVLATLSFGFPQEQSRMQSQT